jgi:hypothetical protein
MAPQPIPASPRKIKRRRHGYRGYGSPLRHEHAGTVHWGRGFAGVGFPEDVGILPPRPDLVTEQLRERLPQDNDSSDSSE